MADEEYQYGSGNGGRSCFGLSCLVVIVATVFLSVLYAVPFFMGPVIDSGGISLFHPYSDVCGWSCCCLGTAGLITGIVLIFIDDPEKAKRKKMERALAKSRARQGR
jgi:hypothetical protein